MFIFYPLFLKYKLKANCGAKGHYENVMIALC